MNNKEKVLCAYRCPFCGKIFKDLIEADFCIKGHEVSVREQIGRRPIRVVIEGV